MPGNPKKGAEKPADVVEAVAPEAKATGCKSPVKGKDGKCADQECIHCYPAEAKTEAKIDVKPDVKPADVKPEVKPEVKPDAKK